LFVARKTAKEKTADVEVLVTRAQAPRKLLAAPRVTAGISEVGRSVFWLSRALEGVAASQFQCMKV
jgi:hypothetical protein